MLNRTGMSAGIQKIMNLPMFRAIQQGLNFALPVLLIGSAALIIASIPIPAYQGWVRSFSRGVIVDTCNLVHTGTFGILSLYVTMVVSYSYAVESASDMPYCLLGVPITALICFVLVCGSASFNYAVSAFGAEGMFTALTSTIVSSWMYVRIARLMHFPLRVYADGADRNFNLSVDAVLPALIVVTLFATGMAVLATFFDVVGLHDLLIDALSKLFHGRNFFSGMLFVFLTTLLWFFGIHGSNVLEGPCERIFVPGLAENAALIAADKAPNVILTKPFFDVFIFIGGCGTSLALLLILLFVSKRGANRRLAKLSALPVFFNINEIILFGLPIVLNPGLLIPFVLTPLACYLLAYGAMSLGLVPLTTMNVEWTTPLLLGGWQTTGSISGALLQLCCVLTGVAIYWPFVRSYERKQEGLNLVQMDQLVTLMKRSENDNAPVALLDQRGALGSLVRTLVSDLHWAIESNAFDVYYQPQYSDEGNCIGAEALLRWRDRQFGLIYPPLAIKLAEESDLLISLEEKIFNRVVNDLPLLKEVLGDGAKISVNVTGNTIQHPSYEAFLRSMVQSGRVGRRDIWLEVTEQMAISASTAIEERFRRIVDMGFPLIIDDFSMGNTSVKYLQSGNFQMVKLDGSLIRGMKDNPRNLQIISSIVFLSKSLNFSVLAEFVETAEQRNILSAHGCHLYQGYLYSPALPLRDLNKKIQFLTANVSRNPLS